MSYNYKIITSILTMVLITKDTVNNFSGDQEVPKNVTEEFEPSNYSFTQLLRIAYYNQKAKEYLKNTYDLNPLPIKKHIIIKGQKREVELYQHQIKSLMWMRERTKRPLTGIHGGIVVLKQGLGKTLTSIVHGMCFPKKDNMPNLVVCSKTLMEEWRKQGFEKFFGDKIKVLYLHKSYGNWNDISRSDILKYDFVVTTYDTIVRTFNKSIKYQEQVFVYGDEHTLMHGRIIEIKCRSRQESNNPRVKGYNILFSTPWSNVYADESAVFANPKTTKYKAMMGIYGDMKWCLTGTPVRNYETDIWSQFRFCGYLGVSNPKEWKNLRETYMRRDFLKEAIFSVKYDDTEITLPTKHKEQNNIPLSEEEEEFYKFIISRVREEYSDMLNNITNYANVLAMFTKLRQICIAPHLLTVGLENEEIIEGVGCEMTQWLFDKTGTSGYRSSKITEIMHIIDNIPKGEKVLIFSHFTSALQLITEACEEIIPYFSFLSITGSDPIEDRKVKIETFKTSPTVRGLFLSYRIGSMGLNLSEANHVILVEPWWSPDIHEQAISRGYRTGQKKEFHVYFPIINIQETDSIENQILELCEKKKNIARETLEGSSHFKEAKLDKKTMGRLLGL